MDFGNLIFDFRKELEYKRYSKSSIDQYCSCLKNYLEYFQKRPKDINKDEIKDYLYELTLLNKSPQLIIQVISSLKKFYKIIIKQPNKLKGIDNPKISEKLVQPLSVNEVKILINSIENLKHKSILQVMYSGGLRISEIINLKWDHLHRDRNLTFIKNGKGNKDRYVPLYKETIEILEKYWYKYKSKEYIFNGQFNSKYSSSSIRQFLSRYSKQYLGKHVYPHLLRHSYLTHLHESGLSLRTIQKIAGHNNSKTTERYTKVSNKEVSLIKYPLSA